jgi:eukaryotic-like serine/threonine-protein kinase
MPDQAKCPGCGAVLPPDGQCVHCLLRLGIGQPPAGKPDLSGKTVPEAAPEKAPGPAPEGTIQITAASETVGERIGRYKLLQQIGEGGMGSVWMAMQEEPVRRRVALKVIKLGMDTRSVIARFEAERQALALMDHPNIAKVLDAGATDTGRPYFVMELVRGIPITDYCDKNNLTTKERLNLFTQVCQAIQHAHQKGIIHRDIKPSNILVTLHDGVPVPKVIDFGIAKATGQQRLTDKTILTALGQFMGTPAYMSPEQAEMSGLDIDTRTDIYALGVLLYELLTGKTPFDAKELIQAGLDEMRRIIREKEPVRPSTRINTLEAAEQTKIARCRQVEPPKLVHHVRGDLDWIVMKCLEKDRTRRYDSATGLAADVQRHLENEPVLAGPPTAGYRLKKFVRKHRTAVAVAAGFAFLLTAATVLSVALAVRAQKSEAEVRSVLGFFADKVLASARPEGQDGGLGYEVTLRAAIDAAVPAIPGAFTNHPLAEASIRDVVGTTYYDLSDFTNAIRNHKEALKLRKAELGPNHRKTLNSMNNLASAYLDAGRLNDGLALSEEALKLKKAKLGRDDRDTLTAMNNLALAYQHAGRLNDALALHEETFKLQKAKLGPDHPDALRSMNNLAAVYSETGRNDEAIKLYEQTLELQKAKLGVGHPETLTSMCNLATAYQAAGRLDKALPLYEETLKLGKAKLGADHSRILTIMNNLAYAYAAADRVSEALPLFEEALKLKKAKLGPEHPDTLATMNGLASAYQDAGRLNEAIKLFEKTLELMKVKLGPDHHNTLVSMGGLADAYNAAGRRAEAIKLYEQTHELMKAKLGPDHPETLTSVSALASAYEAAGRLNEALPLYEEKLKLRMAKLGPNHPDTLRTMNNLAKTYAQAGLWDRALNLASNNPAGLLAIGTLLASTNLLDKALVTLTRAIELAGASNSLDAGVRVSALRRRGEVLQKLGRLEESKSDMAAARAVPPRSKATPAGLLDLSAFFNAALYENWHNRQDTGNNLAALPSGLQTFGGVQFDVRGIVQLSSKELKKLEPGYPTAVTNLAVGLVCRQLHCLIGAGWAEESGTVIARYVVHYADGQTNEIAVVYGRDLWNWQFWPEAEAREKGGPDPVWKGPQERWKSFWPKWGVRLHKLSWNNPRPEVQIKSLDFVSAMTKSAPFVIAITGEP